MKENQHLLRLLMAKCLSLLSVCHNYEIMQFPLLLLNFLSTYFVLPLCIPWILDEYFAYINDRIFLRKFFFSLYSSMCSILQLNSFTYFIINNNYFFLIQSTLYTLVILLKNGTQSNVSSIKQVFSFKYVNCFTFSHTQHIIQPQSQSPVLYVPTCIYTCVLKHYPFCRIVWIICLVAAWRRHHCQQFSWKHLKCDLKGIVQLSSK